MRRLAILVMVLLFSVAALQLWTQHKAKQYGNHAALGQPLYEAHYFRRIYVVYAPWKALVWQWHWGTPRQRWLMGGIGGGGALLGLVLLGTTGKRQRNRTRPPAMEGYGTRTWATMRDIKKAGLFQKRGIVLGAVRRWWCWWRILRYDGEENVLIVAPERSGKGTCIFIPTLFEMGEADGHVIVLDIRGATYQTTARYRAGRSQVIRLSLMQPGSARFSLPQAIRRGTPLAFMDAAAIGEMHINTADAKGDAKFWHDTSKALLTCALLYETETEYRPTMRNITRFWSYPGRDARATVEDVLRTTRDDIVAELAQEVLSKTDKEAGGILSTMMSNLFIYRDPRLAENTSSSDFTIDDFMQQDYWLSLYIVQSPAEQAHVRPFLRAFLRCAMARWMETDGQKHKITMLLDEYPDLGRMDFHIENLSKLGGYGIRTLIAAQNVPQLKHLCDDPDLLMERCKVRVFYAGQGMTTGREISRQLGTGTAVTTQETTRADGWSWAIADSKYKQPQIHSRPMMTEAEATEIDEAHGVIHVTGHPPIWASKLPYFRYAPWQQKSEGVTC